MKNNGKNTHMETALRVIIVIAAALMTAGGVVYSVNGSRAVLIAAAGVLAVGLILALIMRSREKKAADK